MTGIAVQMWTVRHAAQQDLLGTLQRLKALGYEAVETAGLYGHTAAEMRQMLASVGLGLASAHLRLPDEGPATALFAELVELGAPAVFPSLHQEHFGDDAAIGKAAERFNRAVPAAHDAGIELGYHNHWWEFTNRASGRVAYDLFLQRLDPSVTLEVDTYWAEVGGVDAAELVASLGERVHYLHIKDGPIDQASPQCAVGQGEMDIEEILRANPAVRWHVVELDECAGDLFDALRDSLAYLATRVS